VLQPTVVAAGTVSLSVRRYPVTAALSVAVKLLTGTVSDPMAGMVKTVTTGFWMSMNVAEIV